MVNIYLFIELLGSADATAVLDKLKTIATLQPQPEVHIRADKRARYEAVADTLAILQRGGMRKVGFIAEPPHGE